MRGPKVVIDADHRFTEVLDLAQEDVFALSDDPQDNVDPDNISRCLYENMPGSGVKTIIVDSLTAIITPIVVKVMQDKEKGRQRNLMAGMKESGDAFCKILYRDGVPIVYGFITCKMLVMAKQKK